MGKSGIESPLTYEALNHRFTWGARNGVYYFIGNLPSHISHAMATYKRIGGTFIVLSQIAYDYCIEQKISVVMVEDKPDLFLEFEEKDTAVTTLYINERAKIVLFYDVFSINRYIAVPQVMLTHGNSFKDYYIEWRRELLPFFTKVASLGPYNEDKILNQGVDMSQVARVGLSRSDEIIRQAGHINYQHKLASQLGLNQHKKIITYAPTWWGPTSVNEVGKLILKYTPEEYNFIFRPHPNTPRELIDQYLEIMNTDKLNAAYISDELYPNIDINTIYAASSLFIGDMSSVLLDMLLTNKPIIFAFGEGDHAQDKSVYIPIREIFDTSFHVDASNAHLLGKMIADSLRTPIDSEVWDTAKQRVFYGLNGDSTERIIDLIRNTVAASMYNS